MKKIQLIILIIGYTSICLAQCDGFDPNSPLEHTTSVWDWRDDSPNNWIAYVPNESNIGVEFYLDSPFEPNLFYDDNVNDLYVNSVARDYQPEDG